ncbi:MAG: cellobiose phosphorylase [Anaerolineae bacterium]|nr:cellobiose phosphorylase [Anaerolineae bacterium]
MSNQFDSYGRFVLNDFSSVRPFASFLPGIAGLSGIPMWVFYTNRGQAIASFGVESKDHPIMEYMSANKAYQLTSTLGFRTFLRGQRDGEVWHYEPFSLHTDDELSRRMFVGMNEVEIEEVHLGLGLKANVLYFTLPGEPLAGLVRQVTFHNTGSRPLVLEALDGMPAVVPFGVDNNFLKHMGRTIEAWTDVVNIEEGIPFYKLRATAVDTTEVYAIQGGNFALAFADGDLLPAAADPAAVFGFDTAFAAARPFYEGGMDAVFGAQQNIEARTPCAFFGAALELAPGTSQTITGLYGYAAELSLLTQQVSTFLTPGYIDARRSQGRALIADLTEPIATQSAIPTFDAYCRQTFLDNIMRGGWPVVLGGRHIYHVYSRKHGDMERDYNHFFLAAEPYSQGNGSYRDINQNRRSDVFFEPRAGEFNIRLFTSLLQADGHNPLVVKGTTFSLPVEKLPEVLAQVEQPDGLTELLSEPFTPGRLLKIAGQSGLRMDEQAFLDLVLGMCQQSIEADPGEVYWVDHWTYNLDLIESYLAVYPERKAALLFDSEPLPFYDSASTIQPRSCKYVLAGGEPRQLNAISEDEEKAALIASRAEQPRWVRTQHGCGEVFRLPLFSKLVLLAALKFATLDPLGMGIEMEAGRPGWCDAMNGLPSLFGSSMPETFELLRLIDFLLEALKSEKRDVSLPVEGQTLLQEALAHIDHEDRFARWDATAAAREAYRESTRLGFDGAAIDVSAGSLLDDLERMRAAVHDGARRAVDMNGGLPPTYLTYRVSAFDVLDDVDAQGRAVIHVREFDEPTILPLFLEGAVRCMKVLGSKEEALSLHQKVMASDLYDPKLHMLKLNASLGDQPHTIGRMRAFPPGWLENESVWLHMAYKYLLEVLKAGLYDQFFDALKTTLVPFMDAAVYGRSPLENSSFIVSSAHPDANLHGAGFVARLSGATAEFLNIWQVMMVGARPFCLQNGELRLALRPVLPGWLFDDRGRLSFRFLGNCSVTYYNSERRDTTDGMLPGRAILRLPDDETVTLLGETIPPPYAAMIREGRVPALDIYLE